jgi:hypothetical protein
MNRIFLALAAGLLIAAGAASAQTPRSGMTHGGDAAAAVITALEGRLIRDYFKGLGRQVLGAGHATEPRAAAKGRAKAKGKKKGKAKHAPPGLAKRQRLPPGLAKRDTLPPGLRGPGLPGDLSTALPRRRPGQEFRVFDDDVALIETATGRVIDILRDVLGGH